MARQAAAKRRLVQAHSADVQAICDHPGFEQAVDAEIAGKGWIWHLRAIISEKLVIWSLAMAPDGFTPSTSWAIILAAQNPQSFLGAEQILPAHGWTTQRAR